MSQRKFRRAQEKSHKVKEETGPAAVQQPSLQAMVYYKEEDWDTLMNLFTDAEKLPKTYHDWYQRAEKIKGEIEKSGDVVFKVFIDPQTFPKWCAEKGLPMDSEARSQLAIEVAQTHSFNF